MPDQPKDPIDPKNFLLPKKETGPSPLSAQRVNAGALFEQEQKAAEQKLPPSGEMNTTPTPPVGTFVPPPPKPEPKKEEPTVHAVQTYTTDISSVMKSGTVSAVTIAAAEAERRAKPTTKDAATLTSTLTQEEKTSRWRIALLVGGAVLILAALGLVATFLLRAAPQPATTTAAEAPFMSVDQVIPITLSDTTRDTLVTQLEAAREQVALPVGLVAQLQVGMPAQQLLATLVPSIPPDLLRTVLPTYLLGVHSFDENQTFIVLRVDSYQQAYSGLLAWEQNMQGELAPLFTRHPSPKIPSANTASTSASTTPDFIKTGFVDKIVENHDARVILNSAGDILLLWTFLDRNTVVIATNEYTLREVIRRINTASLVPQPQQ